MEVTMVRGNCRPNSRGSRLQQWCIAFVFCSVCLGLAGAPSRVSAQSFTVTAASFQDYTVNGQLDPAITLTRGQTYEFQVNAPGHPFFIKTTPGSGTGNQYTNGVTGNGVTAGTLTFAVPLDAPPLLFYQCSAHAPMSGQINIVSAPSVPAAGPSLQLALALCLLGVGALAVWPRGGRATL
jgi:hypothetical protein